MNQNQENNKKNPFIQDFFEISSKISTFFIISIYICGFLALNAFFYKYNIVDVDLINSNYLVVGSLFILYITTYGIFAGRSIILGKVWLQQQIELLNKTKHRNINSFFVFTHSIIETIFMHCMAVAFFSIYAFTQNGSIIFYLFLMFAFLIKYPLDVFNLDIKFPFVFLIIDTIIKLIAIWVFFHFSTNEQLTIVFLTFFGFSLYINFVLDSFERYKINRDRIIFTTIYSIIFFLGSAVLFGTTIYGNISKKIGGGQSIPVEVSVNKNISKSLSLNIDTTIYGNYIYLSKENLYIKIKDNVYILPRQSINWLKFKEQKFKNISSIIENVLDNNKSKSTNQKSNKSLERNI